MFRLKIRKNIVSILLVLSLVTSLFTGCSSKASGNVNEKLELAVKYLSEQKYDEAILAYQEVIKIDSKNVTAYKGISLAYVLQEKTDQAEQALQDGLKAVPNNDQLQLAMAGLMLDQGNNDKAEAIYKELINSDNPPLTSYQAYIYYLNKQRRVAEAIALLEQAAAKNTQDYKLNSMLAELYYKNGDKEKALAAINKSLTAQLDQSTSYELLVGMYKGKWTELIVLGDQYILQNQAKTGQLLKLSGLLGMGKYDDVIKLYGELAADLKDNTRARYIAAEAYIKLGQNDQSTGILKAIKVADIKDAGMLADLANYYLEIGDEDNARKLAMLGISADNTRIESYVVMFKSYAGANENLAKIWVLKYLLISSLSYDESLSQLADYKIAFNSSTQSEGELTSKEIIARIVRDKTWADRVHPNSPQSNSFVYLDTKTNVAYQGYAEKNNNWKPYIKRYHSPTIYTKDNIPADALANMNRNYSGGWNQFISENANPFNKIILVCGSGITGKISWPNPVVIQDTIPFEEHLKRAGYPIENITFVDM